MFSLSALLLVIFFKMYITKVLVETPIVCEENASWYFLLEQLIPLTMFFLSETQITMLELKVLKIGRVSVNLIQYLIGKILGIARTTSVSDTLMVLSYLSTNRFGPPLENLDPPLLVTWRIQGGARDVCKIIG